MSQYHPAAIITNHLSPTSTLTGYNLVWFRPIFGFSIAQMLVSELTFPAGAIIEHLQSSAITHQQRPAAIIKHQQPLSTISNHHQPSATTIGHGQSFATTINRANSASGHREPLPTFRNHHQTIVSHRHGNLSTTQSRQSSPSTQHHIQPALTIIIWVSKEGTRQIIH